LHEFEATVEAADNGGAWLRVLIPPAVSDALGTRGRVTVAGRVNGFAFRSMLMVGDDGAQHLMFGRALQNGARAGAGSLVRMEMGLA
jgi:hypothetical protein